MSAVHRAWKRNKSDSETQSFRVTFHDREQRERNNDSIKRKLLLRRQLIERDGKHSMVCQLHLFTLVALSGGAQPCVSPFNGFPLDCPGTDCNTNHQIVLPSASLSMAWVSSALARISLSSH